MTDCAWINGPPVPDVRLLTTLELLRVWHENRNGPIGISALEELARRLETELKDTQQCAT